MKSVLILFALLLLFVNCQNVKRAENVEYIEIKHVGIEEKTIEPLFISNGEIHIGIEGNYSIINNHKFDTLTDRDQLILRNTYFYTQIIDNYTFQTIFLFLNQFHPFASNKDILDRNINYAIISERKTYYITYKQTGMFFSCLIKFLKEKNCNKDSISALSYYFA